MTNKERDTQKKSQLELELEILYRITKATYSAILTRKKNYTIILYMRKRYVILKWEKIRYHFLIEKKITSKFEKN